ncbi:MAG: excinuclease ABC subunit UvrB [Elusimicrobia bacterium]|nr:excinuclease ABC subunit UvrB [Elusimicrobiota bacterium]
MKELFKLVSPFKPAGDQPQAIKKLVSGLKSSHKHQVLLGVTGSGKTFTAANLIKAWDGPVLVISPNKVLAAQLYAEFKSFFPENAVEYFISYYDYYQPEAYIPQTDTYIEKDAAINEHIERLRLKATSSVLSRRDVIVVASVSCIYNIGDPQDVKDLCLNLKEGAKQSRDVLTGELVRLQYERNDVEFAPGRFRGRGAMIEIFPPYLEDPVRLTFDAGKLAKIETLRKITGETIRRLGEINIYPSRHFVTPQARIETAMETIKWELEERRRVLKAQGRLLEAQRLESRTKYDLAMMKSVGFCNGIENYSRHLSGRLPGQRPFCLIDYFASTLGLPEAPAGTRSSAKGAGKEFLMLIDESHVAIPQIRGMYEGDRSRKEILVEHGFRLPSALDNRPLKFDEFKTLGDSVIYISATPGPYELSLAGKAIIEQIVRPTGLVDPQVEVHPIKGQMSHLIEAIKERVKAEERTLVTTLTKRMAEELADYLLEMDIKTHYLHSEVQTLERVEILRDLRLGVYDVVVGSMERALGEMERRRKLQVIYNQKHKITPRSIVKGVEELEEFEAKAKSNAVSLVREAWGRYEAQKPAAQIIRELEKEMKEAAERLDFELAAALRDRLFELKSMVVKK